MKLVTFEVKTETGVARRLGILHGSDIIDLNTAYASYLGTVRGIYRSRELADALVPPDMLRFIEGGKISMEAGRKALEHFESEGRQDGQDGARLIFRFDEVALLAPVPRPVSIRDCSAFLQHHRNMLQGRELPDDILKLPVHYRASSTDVAGPETPIFWPSYTEKLDYELEVAVCISKYGVNIPEVKAGEYIFGYTIYNDVSARDMQVREMRLRFGPGKGKSFKNSNIMGPCLVTPDELDAGNLRMMARINGEVWSDGNTRDMHFKFPQLIAYLSKDDPIYPGEFIGSGTIGFGSGMELDKWIKPGDIVELEVEGIGILRNKVERHT